ncbi:unnamed protein product [Adineta steineri]|uniref:Adenylate kinase n=1 Tax=Adineta steineri TaxID=433720 RepID=A0A819ZBE0_9BILA|nr:unnamed protein product [Adineta steineri]
MSDRVNLQCALLFDCDEKTSINRCMERGRDSGRIDDNEESLKKRIATYQGSTKAVIQYYEKENLVKQIDVANDVVEENLFSHSVVLMIILFLNLSFNKLV